MANTVADSTTYLSSSQLINHILEQVYKPQLLVNLNATELCSIHRHEVYNKNDDINSLFKIYHQNIQGLKGKINEFMLTLVAGAPHLICFTEHHLKDYEIDATPISNYKLGAKYCRKN